MNNYNNSSNFEALAIKILEEYLGVKFDNEKTKITQKTRDFGVDAFVYIENESFSKIRTIEAKLRSYNYTLALKDIATSIIFFILRHGDEHYIITNVFLTEGTKKDLELINDNNSGNISYIDGEVTKRILEIILPKLKDDELIVAKRIIDEFPKLKMPKAYTPEEVFYSEANTFLYESRKICLKNAFEELKKKRWISLSGCLGVGKHLISQKLIEKHKKNNFIIININAISNGLISNFCYEITNQLFNLNINDLISIVKNDDLPFYNILNDEERENLNNLYTIFDNRSMAQDSSVYLVKQYLLNLFKSFNKQYLIVIDNFDSVSSELFNLIAQLSNESNTNFKFVVLTNTNSEFYFEFFNFEFRKVFYNTFSEININELAPHESIDYIQTLNQSIRCNDSEKIYKYIGGNPKLLEEYVKNYSIMFSTIKNITGFTDVTTYYNLEAQTCMQNDDILRLFFLIFIFNKLYLNEIEHYFNQGGYKNIKKFIFASPLIRCENGALYFCSNYVKDIVEFILLEKKNKIMSFNNNLIIDIEGLDSLNQIIYFYFSNDGKLLNIYNNSKNYWNHKNNLEWNIKSIKYICLYLKYKKNNSLDWAIDFCKFSNILFENSETITKNNYSNIIDEFNNQINNLENYFYNCDIEYKNQIAFVLFDYYICTLQKTNKIKSANILFEIEKKAWFQYIDEYRKIKFLRLKALSFKSLGEKTDFYNQLDKLKLYNTPYAKFSYYANMAAQYYNTNPLKAYDLLSKCPFGHFDNDDLQKFELWIENDFAIVLFYLNSLVCSYKCANIILQKSLQLSYDENIARSYNIIALIELINNNNKLAEENLYNAIKYSLYCNNDSILHFSTNYLNICYNKEVESICYNYFKVNADSIQKIFDDKKSSKRLIVSLISFLDVLKEHNKSKYFELYALFTSAIDNYKDNGTELKINNKYFVLF